MKIFTQITLITLLISSSVFSQTKDEPVRNPTGVTVVSQSSNSQLILLSPADGKLFNSSEGSKPVLFRWTAVVPKPKEAVTYRLRVWQLMEGQNGMEAMRNNQPIITKDVINITQAAISNLYTGPCKPPYLCDFVWGIEVLNSDGVSIGNSSAANSSFKFEVENGAVKNTKYGNPANPGSYGMSSGKSLGADGDTGFKYKTYQPEKPVFGNATQPPSPDESIDKELDKNQPNAKKVDKELDKNQPNAKSIDKELDKNQPNAKSIDKELDKNQPNAKKVDKELDKNQPNAKRVNDCCMNPCCSEKLKPAILYLPIEKTVYDSNGNITGVMVKTETGELSSVKVIVAGSNSISGGYTMLKTEKGEPIIAKVVVAGSHSISGGIK